MFLKNMIVESWDITRFDQASNPIDFIEYAAHIDLAFVYYEAVARIDAAFKAFCNATPNQGSHPECDPRLQDYLEDNLQHTHHTDTGNITGNYYNSVGAGVKSSHGGGGAHIIMAYCETWEFPDGFGGHYYLHRNCTYDW